MAMDNDVHMKSEGSFQEKDNQLLQSKLDDMEREVVVLREVNKALECEKQNGQKEVEIWKQKCKEMESLLLVLQGSPGFGDEQLASVREKEELVKVGNMSAAVIQDIGIHCEKTSDKSVNYKHDIQVINLDGDETAPCTPAGARPTNTSAEAVPYCNGQENEDDASHCNDKFPFVMTCKRKRSLNIVTSDTESDDDDKIPIGQFVRKKYQRSVPQPAVSESDESADLSTPKRKRLVKLSQYSGRKKTTETDESENDDDDSMGSFIESSSDVSRSVEEASDDNDDDDVAQDSSNSSDDYIGILDRIRRTKDHVSEWELEGDMLADFGKNPELCMKAVCALYRREISVQQEFDGTFVDYRDGIGFNRFDAPRAAEIAEFLTDGDLDNDVTKSVEQLNAFDPDGQEVCQKLAARYSKQLFDIYNDREDPYFRHP